MIRLSPKPGVIAAGVFLAAMTAATCCHAGSTGDMNHAAYSIRDTASDSSVRVIIVIDKSYSMCRNPGSPDGCCAPGDGSGNCLMNDPEDRRVEAAHWFVDSLSMVNPGSQAGIVIFDEEATVYEPVTLNSDSTMTRVHDRIEQAACADGVTLSFTPFSKTACSPAALAKSKATSLGMVLQKALEASDYRYVDIPAGMARHIILLTDGAWDDAATRGPDTVINAYASQFPDRKVPKVHGVLLLNRDLHAIHGYPEDGCSSAPPEVPGNLERATILTGGTYLGSSTPTTVLAGFRTLFAAIAANLAASVEQPFNRQGLIAGYRLPTRTEAYFNLLGRKAGSVQPGNPAANRLPNGIYLNATKEKPRQQKNIIVK